MKFIAFVGIVFLVQGSIVTGQIESTAGQSLSLKQSVEFKLKERADTYALTSDVSVEARILNERGAKTELFTLYEPFYAPIKKLKVKVNSSSISSDNISYGSPLWTDVFLADQKQYVIHFPSSLKINDVIAYSYQQQYSEVAFLPILFVRNVDELREYRAIFNHPEDVTVEFEFYFPRDTVAYTIDRSDNEETILLFHNLRHSESLEFLQGDEYHAAILVSLKKGNGSINPVQPGDYIAWYHGKTSAQPRMDSLHERSFDRKLSGKMTRGDSVSAIHDSVRTSIRYVADERGLSAYIPRPPSVTLQNGFGDCKDRVALVCGLAYEYGIPTLTVLVPGEDSPKFSGAHVGMFNHVIGAFSQEGQLTFFDPTAKYCEFGNLPDNVIGKSVFVMDPKKPRFETIPIPTRKPSLDVTIQAQSDSLDRCKARIILRNRYFSDVLHARHDLTEEKLKQMLTSLVATRLYQVRLESFKVAEESYDGITVTAVADLSRFILPSSNKYYVPRTPFAQFDNDILERENDRFVLEFSSPIDMRLQLNMIAPNMSVQPETVTTGDVSFSFSARAGSTGSMTTFDYHYRRNTMVVQPENKAAFFNHYKSYLANKKNVFVMIRR